MCHCAYMCWENMRTRNAGPGAQLSRRDASPYQLQPISGGRASAVSHCEPAPAEQSAAGLVRDIPFALLTAWPRFKSSLLGCKGSDRDSCAKYFGFLDFPICASNLYQTQDIMLVLKDNKGIDSRPAAECGRESTRKVLRQAAA
jgi:hypothetical protein